MRLIIILFLTLLITACVKPATQLDRIKKSGELKVLIRNSPSIYYEGPFGPTGFEYDLLKRFSDSLGVKLKLVVQPNANELLNQLSEYSAHLAAAKLAITLKRQQQYLFTIPYHSVSHQLVYRSGTRRPKKLKDIEQLNIEISDDDSVIIALKQLNLQYPNLKWHINKDASPEDLMSLVNEKKIEFTIVSSDEIKINRRFYPELRVAYDINEPQQIGWAFAKTDDLSLYNAANNFLNQQLQSGALQALIDQHFGHMQSFDYVGTRIYQRHIKSRLPQFRPWFEKAGKDNKIDWILLAAMGYQESHWDKNARSPTGVRGVMMLTRDTAKYLGINNRVEPFQSIFGGAYYFARLIKRLPDSVKEPNRTFFALASYNLGYGHVRDAMKLASAQGLNENSWTDLKKVLPLLRKKKWYKKTRYGYARGNEAVQYVENIRSYYDILKWEVAREWREEIQLEPAPIPLNIPDAL
jgi:membrane-bound lytic murein transglycosylase F